MAAASTFVPGRVGVVGLGLIGGSFVRAFHAAGREVFAFNRTHATLELAMIETVDGELNAETVPTCELIILAGYPEASVAWLEEHADFVSADAIVIDAAGVKRRLCERCFALAEERDWTFVGCHPMAGTQFSGYAHSRANMFEGAPLVVVPPAMDDFARAEVLERLKKLLAPCGFGSFTLSSAALHDEVIAFTSQLAHVVSNAYIKSPTALRHKGFSAGSYKDMTRVAWLDSAMWAELFLENRDYVLSELDTFLRSMEQYRAALQAGDEETLRALLEEGRNRKEEVDGH